RTRSFELGELRRARRHGHVLDRADRTAASEGVGGRTLADVLADGDLRGDRLLPVLLFRPGLLHLAALAEEDLPGDVLVRARLLSAGHLAAAGEDGGGYLLV